MNPFELDTYLAYIVISMELV